MTDPTQKSERDWDEDMENCLYSDSLQLLRIAECAIACRHWLTVAKDLAEASAAKDREIERLQEQITQLKYSIENT